MPGEAVKRHPLDEDTAIGFHGHMTHQAGEGPEQAPDDRNRRQRGPERDPNYPDNHEHRKDKKHN